MSEKELIFCVFFIFLLNFIQIFECYENWRNNFQYSPKNLQNHQNLGSSQSLLLRGSQPTELTRTRSFDNGLATNGNEATTATVLQLIKVGLLDGFAIRRIKMFNDRVFLERYRRSYWFGTRYYAIDNQYFFETRETCAYQMNKTERENLEYEENISEPILEIVYQCQRYAQYCCGLDCCQNVNRPIN